MLNIVISFDYELYLGKNYYSCEQVLFEPTNRILDILEKRNVPATFFADVCSVFQHDRYGLTEYSKCFGDQICRMVKGGNDVQLHIHPNWLKSYPENGQWKFDKDSYRIHYFNDKEDEEWTMNSIIKKGVSFLNDTLRSVNSEYKCIAYRAGGFAIQPHENLFSLLHENGIVIDSSVVVNDSLQKGIASYDFRNTPSQLNWWVSSKDLMKESVVNSKDSTGIWEVPVMTIKNSLLERLLLSNKKRVFISGKAMGHPIAIEAQKRFEKWEKVKRILLYNRSYRRLSLDAMNAHYLYKKVMKIYNKFDAKNEDIYISLIGHPKAFTGEAFENLETFVDLLKQQKDKVRIVSMTDIARQLEKV